jgi:hypothetical protein
VILAFRSENNERALVGNRASLMLGSIRGAAPQLDTMKVHSVGLFKSMKRLYSPAGTVMPPMTKGTSVFSRVETFAPARHTGASGTPGICAIVDLP